MHIKYCFIYIHIYIYMYIYMTLTPFCNPSWMYQQSLIESLPALEDGETREKLSILSRTKEDPTLLLYENNSLLTAHSIPINFFGKLPNSTGSLVCPSLEYMRRDVHTFVQKIFSDVGCLWGSMVIQRKFLDYQHFCLDFDLKKIAPPPPKDVVKVEDYDQFIKTRRKTDEYLFCKGTSTSHKDLNINYIIYEIVYRLRCLGIQYDIYVLGKSGGSFERGFHIEVPELVMKYHDLIIMYEILHREIKNEIFFDPSQNYSAFGSTKSNVENVYLPYCCFSLDRGIICNQPLFPDRNIAFDFFNIFKPCPADQKCHSISIFLKGSAPCYKPIVTMELEENEKRIINHNKTKDIDRTIPEEVWVESLTTSLSKFENSVNIIQNTIKMDRENSRNVELKCPTSPHQTYIHHFGNLITPKGDKYKAFKIFFSEALQKSEARRCGDVENFYIYDGSDTCIICNKAQLFPRNGGENYNVSLYTISKKYQNTKQKDAIFGNCGDVTIIHDDRDAERNHIHNSRVDGVSVVLQDPIFKDAHIIDLMDSRRLQHTVHFLVAGYFLCLKKQGHVIIERLLRWLWLLADCFDKNNNIVYDFLQIYNHLNRNVHMLYLSKEWIVMCLKYFIIKKNVIGIEEAVTIIKAIESPRKFTEDVAVLEKFGNKNIFTIRGATNRIVIPDIIVAAILMGGNNEAILYELLSIFRPIIQMDNHRYSKDDEPDKTEERKENTKKKAAGNTKKTIKKTNEIFMWDEVSWKKCQLTTNSAISFHFPEIYYIANIRSHVEQFKFQIRKEKQKREEMTAANLDDYIKKRLLSNWKKDGELVGANEKVDKESVSMRFHCTQGKNSNSIISEIINKIETFWAKTVIFNTPPLFSTILLPDTYVISGFALKGNELVTVRPLPMYFQENLNEFDETLDENFMETVLMHMNKCQFLHAQFFPIIRRILKKKGEINKENKTRKGKSRSYKATDQDREMRASSSQGVLRMSGVNIPGEGGNVCSSDIPLPEIDANNAPSFDEITKADFHLTLTEQLCQMNETFDLIKLTKYFVLRQVANSHAEMVEVEKRVPDNEMKFLIRNILAKYCRFGVDERNNTLQERIKVLANCYQSIARHNSLSFSMPTDLSALDMKPVFCNCPVTNAFFCLLQTFSYDVLSLIYFMKLILRASCGCVDYRCKCLHIFQGSTNSGKTTLLQLILSVFGNQAAILSPNTINTTSVTDRQHDLSRGQSFARFWYMDEIPNRPFNRHLINQITGSSRVFIRANYEAGSNVKLASTILIFGNNKPTFTEQCPALISRLRYMSFRSRFDSNNLVNFKMSQFPKLHFNTEYQRMLEVGMKAIFLHATCHASRVNPSPFYLYDNLFIGDLELTENMRLSTRIYSPINDIIEHIFGICNITENENCCLTHKRMKHLIKELDVLPRLNIASVSDAMDFISEKYPTLRVDMESMAGKCDEDCMDEVLFYGLMEVDVEENNERIVGSRRKRMHNSWSSGNSDDGKKRKMR